MKRKVIYFLFILCSIIICVNNAKAEEEGETNYKTYCKQFDEKDERLNCCDRASNETDVNACKEPVYKSCTKLEDYNERENCCKEFTNEKDVTNCLVLADSTCSSTETVRLSKAASNIKIIYEPYEYKPDGFDDPTSPDYSVIYYWMDIKIYNLTSELYINVNNGKNSYKVDTQQMNSDGVVVLRDPETTEVKNYVFTVYAKSSNCKTKELRTIRLTVPKYNHYSGRAACEDIPQYYLCHQFINFNVDGANFLSNVENYKAKLAKKEIANASDKKDSSKPVVQKVFTSVSNNKYLVIGGILVVGCVITFLILKNKRRND